MGVAQPYGKRAAPQTALAAREFHALWVPGTQKRGSLPAGEGSLCSGTFYANGVLMEVVLLDRWNVLAPAVVLRLPLLLGQCKGQALIMHTARTWRILSEYAIIIDSLRVGGEDAYGYFGGGVK